MRKKISITPNIFVVHLDNQKGFTLMELIMVFVILGVMSSVAIPQYMELAEVTLTAADKYNIGAEKSQATVEWARTLVGAP
jgi:MSHA pilin protein MshA